MPLDVVGTLAASFSEALTEWQLDNLYRHRGEDFCCGTQAWMFFSEEGAYAPELLANCETPPVAHLVTTIPLAWQLTYFNLCLVSETLFSAYTAWEEGHLQSPLTGYSAAMIEATSHDIKAAIERAISDYANLHSVTC